MIKFTEDKENFRGQWTVSRTQRNNLNLTYKYMTIHLPWSVINKNGFYKNQDAEKEWTVN